MPLIVQSLRRTQLDLHWIQLDLHLPLLNLLPDGLAVVVGERKKVLYQQTQHDFEPVALTAVRFLPNVKLDVHILQRAARHQLPVCAPAEH